MNLSALSAKCPSSIENVFMDLILVWPVVLQKAPSEFVITEKGPY